MTDPHDELEDLLRPRPEASTLALRGAILARTERALARLRWTRRAVRSAAVAAAVLAGAGAGWLLKPACVVEVAGTRQAVPVFVPVFVGVEVDASRPPATPELPPSAAAAELQAEQRDDPAEAARLYRAAGDRFLDRHDYPNATRCYRLFLARAGDGGLYLERGDSWLLTSLKNAALKEKIDVPKTHD